jgi:hypothetical protein
MFSKKWVCCFVVNWFFIVYFFVILMVLNCIMVLLIKNNLVVFVMSSLSVRNFEARPVSVCSGEGKRKAREEEKDDKRPNSCYPSSIGKKTKTKESWGSEPTSANTDDTLVSIFSSRTTEIGSSASAALSSERVTPVSLGFSSSMGDASSPVPFRVKTPQGAVRPNIAFSPSLLSQFKSLSQGSKGCFNSPDLAPSVQPNQSASNLSPLFPPGNLTFKGFTSLSNLRTPSNDCNSDEELKMALSQTQSLYLQMHPSLLSALLLIPKECSPNIQNPHSIYQ